MSEKNILITCDSNWNALLTSQIVVSIYDWQPCHLFGLLLYSDYVHISIGFFFFPSQWLSTVGVAHFSRSLYVAILTWGIISINLLRTFFKRMLQSETPPIQYSFIYFLLSLMSNTHQSVKAILNYVPSTFSITSLSSSCQ